MKRIEVHTKHEHINPILDAMKRSGVGGLTVAQVRGRGKNTVPSVRGVRGSAKFVVDFNTRSLIYTIVNDEEKDKVINAILEAVQTQDEEPFGKIFVTDVEEAIDLASGKTGKNAL